MNEKFGQFVRNKREEKKINLRKLAEILDIAPAYMSDMEKARSCLLYTSPSPRDPKTSRMPSSA